MNGELKKASFEKRLGAFIIDHIILSLISTAVFFLYCFKNINQNAENFFSAFPIYMVIVIFIYCFKDIVGGASLGKRIIGLTVRSNNDSKIKPSVFKLFFRNVFSFVWPVELITLLCSKRKFGDRIFGTDVYSTKSFH